MSSRKRACSLQASAQLNFQAYLEPDKVTGANKYTMRAQEFVIKQHSSRIDELFTGGNKWQWDYNSANEAEATFVVGQIQYKFYAYSSEQGVWEVEFKIMEGGNPRNRFGITGTGNAAIVMSTVTDIMREFLTMYKGDIQKLTFSADERSRQNLYVKMISRLLPDWSLTRDHRQFMLTAPEDIK